MRVTHGFQIKAEVATRLAYINQLVNHLDDPEDLAWLRNRLSEPQKLIYVKLTEMGVLDKEKKDLHKGASAK